MTEPLRRDYAADLRESQDSSERAPLAHHLLQLSGCLSLRASRVRQTDLQQRLEAMDALLYWHEGRGIDLDTAGAQDCLTVLAGVARDLMVSEARR